MTGSDDPVVARLRALAADGRTGALHLSGDYGGAVFLAEGRIIHVDSALTPPVEALLLRATGAEAMPEGQVVGNGDSGGSGGTPQNLVGRMVKRGEIDPTLVELTSRAAMADAAGELLQPAVTQGCSTRFRANQRHWLGGPWPVELEALLAEAARRQRLLRMLAHRLTPDTPVLRSTRLPGERIWLTSSQWDLVRHADGQHTARALAWRLGRGVVATTVELARLLDLGALTIPGDGADGAAPPRTRCLFLHASLPPTMPGPGGAPAG